MVAGLEGAVGFIVGFVVGAVLYRWRGRKTEAALRKELDRANEYANGLRWRLYK